jgi:hypothetical protein
MQAAETSTNTDGAARLLLLRAGAPERRHVLHGIAWLVLAAGWKRWARSPASS